MEEIHGLTPEIYRTVLAIVDERMREIKVTREDFDALRTSLDELASVQAQLTSSVNALIDAQARTEERVGGLEAAMQRLAEAQARTEERVGGLEAAMQRLAEAQARTEERVGALEQAQARTEERLSGLEAAMQQLAQAQAATQEEMRRLSQAQAATQEEMRRLSQAQTETQEEMRRLEAAVQRLAEGQAEMNRQFQEMRQQVGALSDNIGYGLEDIARTVLPAYLSRKYGVKVKKLERRFFQVDGQTLDLDLFGEGQRGRRKVTVLGGVKSRIHWREVGDFREKLMKITPLIQTKTMPLMFGYFIDLSATEAAGDEMLLIASYQPGIDE